MDNYEKLLEELKILNIFQIGEIKNQFGKKYKDVSIKEIYEKDKKYILWVKENSQEFTSLNEYNIFKEYSRQALILYYDMMAFLLAQGK